MRPWEGELLPRVRGRCQTTQPQDAGRQGAALLGSGKVPLSKVATLAQVLLWAPFIEQLSSRQGQYLYLFPRSTPGGRNVPT